jgi:hypothetical protein
VDEGESRNQSAAASRSLVAVSSHSKPICCGGGKLLGGGGLSWASCAQVSGEARMDARLYGEAVEPRPAPREEPQFWL